MVRRPTRTVSTTVSSNALLSTYYAEPSSYLQALDTIREAEHDDIDR